MKKLYNTPETILVKTIGNLDMMDFTGGGSGNGLPAEPGTPAPTRKAGTLYI